MNRDLKRRVGALENTFEKSLQNRAALANSGADDLTLVALGAGMSAAEVEYFTGKRHSALDVVICQNGGTFYVWRLTEIAKFCGPRAEARARQYAWEQYNYCEGDWREMAGVIGSD